MPRLRSSSRLLGRPASRRLARFVIRRCVRSTPDRHRGPDELSQALTAYRRALRCHQRLARLAPRFFDTTVVGREAYERAGRRRYMRTWEPILARVYGVAPDYAAIDARCDERPPLPSPRTQRAVERELASWELWMAAAHRSLEQYSLHRPHAVPHLTQIARLLEIAFALRQLCCGQFQPDPQAEAAAEAQWESDLRRAYPAPPPPAAAAPPAVAAASAPSLAPPSPPATPASAGPPPDHKRDLTPFTLRRGAHGLLCLQPLDPMGANLRETCGSLSESERES